MSKYPLRRVSTQDGNLGTDEISQKGEKMKELFSKCDLCGIKKVFRGETVEEIMQAVDNEGWYDFPEDKKIKFICKNCLKKMENDLVSD